jgi:serine/threonine protein kinase
MKISAATPEYLPPEMLLYLENIKNSDAELKAKYTENLFNRSEPWSFDVWALGTILIEIFTGFPIWLSIKCKMTTAHGKPLMG